MKNRGDAQARKADHFALFDEPRRPWLDPEELKQKFHALTVVHHPDLVVEDSVDFTAVNAAYQNLCDPVKRLRHLLELEASALDPQPMTPSPETTELFMQFAPLQQTLAGFLSRHAKAASPVAQALLCEEKFALLAEIESVMEALQARQTRLYDQVRAIDAGWPVHRPFDVLRTLQHDLAYLQKWSDQFRAAAAQLATGF